MFLVGDIGGTKTHLALFEEGRIVKEKKYPSKHYTAIQDILYEFLTENEASIDKITLGIAGPIQNGICKATNLPWTVDAKKLADEFKVTKVHLLNDLEAMAHGVLCLSPSDFFVLNKGNVDATGNAALIAAGTGLGQAGMYWDGRRHRPFTSEGGHADFAAQSEDEVKLWHYLRAKYTHVSYERVLSGPGLFNIYRFLIETGLEEQPFWLQKQFSENDPPRVIVDMALQEKDKACQRALSLFISMYGSESGNLALKMLSLGGLYIGGGIAPNIIEALKSGGFMKAFCDKGRLSYLMQQMPVKVILNDKTSLYGAAKALQLTS
jgi:glucokinase